jgi:N-acetylglutamate synthase-like GNAT family acetyltransferase
VKIRPASEEDIPAIHDAHVLTMKRLKETSPQTSEQGRRGVEEYIAGRRPEHIASEMREQRFVVIEDDGKIIGFGALHIPKTEITMVFVNPEHQRCGAGRKILAALEAIARDEGLVALQLQATGTAIRFYLKVGYQSDPPVEPDAEWALMKKRIH